LQAALNSFFLNQERNNYVVEGVHDSGAKEKVKMMGTGDDVKDIGLELGLAFFRGTNTQQSTFVRHSILQTDVSYLYVIQT
jgi:hypothetical protein